MGTAIFVARQIGRPISPFQLCRRNHIQTGMTDESTKRALAFLGTTTILRLHQRFLVGRDDHPPGGATTSRRSISSYTAFRLTCCSTQV